MKVTTLATPKKVTSQILRRSVALPRVLIEEVFAAAPPEIGHNLNRLVAESLRRFVTQRKAEAFAEEVRLMAADPEIQAISAEIEAEFRVTELDGLL